MARPLRIEYDGALYHITSRGNARKPIFKDEEDRTIFLDILHKVNERYNWLCHAHCLMNNHYHIVKAVGKYGYSQKDVADYLEMHYSTISRTMKNEITAKSKSLTPFTSYG